MSPPEGFFLSPACRGRAGSPSSCGGGAGAFCIPGKWGQLFSGQEKEALKSMHLLPPASPAQVSPLTVDGLRAGIIYDVILPCMLGYHIERIIRQTIIRRGFSLIIWDFPILLWGQLHIGIPSDVS